MNRFGLRVKLIAVPGLVLLVAALVSVALLFSRVDDALERKQGEQFALAGGVLHNVYRHRVEQLHADMVQTTAQVALYDGYFAAQQDDRAFLRRFLDQVRGLTGSDEVLVVGHDGKVLVRSGDDRHGDQPPYSAMAAPMLAHKTLADQAALARAIFSRLIRTDDGTVELVVVGPVLDVETVVGSVVFAKRLDDRFLEDLRETIGGRTQLSVVDGHGVVATTFGQRWELPARAVADGDEMRSEVAGNPYRHAFFALDDGRGPYIAASFDLNQDMAATRELLIAIGVVFLGGIAAVLGTIIGNVLHIVRSLDRVMGYADRIAQGDLSGDIVVKGHDEVGRLARAFAAMSAALAQIATSIHGAAECTSRDAEKLARATEHLASGASAETAQTEQMAAALTKMSQTAQEVARSAGSAADAAHQAYELAQTGTARVQVTVEAIQAIAGHVDTIGHSIQALGERSSEIGQIVTVIEGIAEQTNLLALNAAIEAARAGEQGRGFAVVADEVRTLAGRTAKATKEISAMIAKIQEETSHSVEAMANGRQQVTRGVEIAGQTRDAMSGIVVAANHSMDMIYQIATAAEEQSQVSEQVSEAVEQIVDMVRDEEQEAATIRQAVDGLRGTATELRRSAQWFRT